ncbi:uncharacterized protein LOC123557975 [Mercenaria mercenaria]|uniref:uncharacterized protein LOC123557975 n=1 Tax=Mercenaria mercenaria TaxID=6596 RepID=UPI00234EEE37|nr:uncharacterized protein LOC123557975 [Mercenaria mercenaria]
MLETLKKISDGTRFYEQYSHRVVYKHKETASDFLKTMEDMKTKGNVKGKRKLSSQKREWQTMSPKEELFSEEDWTYMLVYLEFLFQTNMKTNVTVWIDLVLPRCIAKPGIYSKSKRSVEDTFTKINGKTSSDVYSEKIGADMKPKSALLKKSTVLCAEQSCTRQWPASRMPCNSMTSEEKQSLDHERSCKICYGEEACVVFLPCSHMIACENCSSMLQNCAMCRSLIRGSFVVELNITI